MPKSELLVAEQVERTDFSSADICSAKPPAVPEAVKRHRKPPEGRVLQGFHEPPPKSVTVRDFRCGGPALAPNRLSASSRRALSREARPPWVDEVTLSQELRTARLPRPHVLVGYQWSHTGLRPGRKTSHNRYIRSFVSHPPQIRACTSRAPGSSSHEFATRAIRCCFVNTVAGLGVPIMFPSNGS